MSIIATESQKGKAVRLTSLGDQSPTMIVTGVNEKTKDVAVGWLDKNNSYQTATFLNKALEKVGTGDGESTNYVSTEPTKGRGKGDKTPAAFKNVPGLKNVKTKKGITTGEF